jgi:phosphoenolpyruvate synthase/pyruvate phosphate dikinase
MIAAEGILTAKGGVSSHAALVARQMGKVCICGAAACRSTTRQDPHRRGQTS